MTRPRGLALDPGDVHLWVLQVAHVDIASAAHCLNAGEQSRARRYTSASAGREFAATRAALRMLLGHYLHCAAADVQIVADARGKPRLAAPATLQFNVSHSGGLGLLAFAAAGELGVDVEAIRPFTGHAELAALARQVFDADDAAAWLALPDTERPAAFYRAWTRKEACAKAGGQGLGADLRAIRVRLDRGGDTHITPLGDVAGRVLYDIGIGAAFAAALACAHGFAPAAVPRWIDPATLHGASST